MKKITIVSSLLLLCIVPRFVLGLQINISIEQHVQCKGDSTGRVEVAAGNGTAPYTFVWNDPDSTEETENENISYSLVNTLPAGEWEVMVYDAAGDTLTETFTINEPEEGLSLTLSKDDPLCPDSANGQAMVSVSGGTAPYDYAWDDAEQQSTTGGGNNDTAFGLAAGAYHVTVTDDNGCAAEGEVSLSEPEGMSLSTLSGDASCNEDDGYAYVSVSGGIAPYDYAWDDPRSQTTTDGPSGDTADGLGADAYTVMVTDSNGCQQSAEVTVGNSEAPDIVIDSFMVSCYGGNDGLAIATAYNTVEPYSYEWDNGQTGDSAKNLEAGTYRVTATDGSGCITQQTVQITQPDSLHAEIAAQTDITCEGDSNGTATVDVTGGIMPYSYTWNDAAQQTTPKAEGLAPGTYTVRVSDANGCMDSAEVSISEPDMLTINMAYKVPGCADNCDGFAEATPSGGHTPYSYQWNDPDYQTTQRATDLCNGTYVVTVSDSNDCSVKDTVTLVYDELVLSTSTEDATCGNANGQASVQASGGAGEPFTYQWNDADSTTNDTLDNVSSGTYRVTVSDENGCSANATVNIKDSDGPELSVTDTTHVTCAGDSTGMIVAAADGNSPFTYQWDDADSTQNDTLNGVPAGEYTVSVTDNNNCKASESIVIEEPDYITAAVVDVEHVQCPGDCNGSVTLEAQGGMEPYTYYIAHDSIITHDSVITDNALSQNEPVFTQVCAGNYNLWVEDSNGCRYTGDLMASVSVPDTLTLSVSKEDATCGEFNGSATVSAAGGAAPYDYQWSDGTNLQTNDNLSAGEYSCIVSDDHGCRDTIWVTINDADGPALNISSSDVSCYGAADGMINVEVSGGTAPYTYNWNGADSDSSGAVNLNAGTYSLDVEDVNGCYAGSGAITISEPDSLWFTNEVMGATCSDCNDGSITLDVHGGTEPYTYSLNDSVEQDSNAFTGLPAGNYTITVSDDHGCTYSDADTVGVINAGSVNQAGHHSVTAKPVPADQSVTLSFAEDHHGEIKIINQTGKVFWKTKKAISPVVVNTAAWPAGVYILRYYDAGQTFTKKLLIMH